MQDKIITDRVVMIDLGTSVLFGSFQWRACTLSQVLFSKSHSCKITDYTRVPLVQSVILHEWTLFKQYFIHKLLLLATIYSHLPRFNSILMNAICKRIIRKRDVRRKQISHDIFRKHLVKSASTGQPRCCILCKLTRTKPNDWFHFHLHAQQRKCMLTPHL